MTKKIWEGSRSLVISLWSCHVTKERLFVLHSTSSDTIAIEVVALPIGIIASIDFRSHRVLTVGLSLLVGISLSPSRWAQSSASHSKWTPRDPPLWDYLSVCPVRGPYNVSPGGAVPSSTWVPLPAVGEVEVCSGPRSLLSRCLANGVLVVTVSIAWAPLLVARAPSPHAFVCTLHWRRLTGGPLSSCCNRRCVNRTPSHVTYSRTCMHSFQCRT